MSFWQIYTHFLKKHVRQDKSVKNYKPTKNKTTISSISNNIFAYLSIFSSMIDINMNPSVPMPETSFNQNDQNAGQIRVNMVQDQFSIA